MTAPGPPPFVAPTPADLGVILKDTTIDQDRAAAIIADVVTLCASYVTLTGPCAVVVKRVAARAYVSIVSPRGPQMGAGGSPFGTGSAVGAGGITLWKSDVRDLRRLAGGTSAFDIDMLPAGYVPPYDLPYWDASSVLGSDAVPADVDNGDGTFTADDAVDNGDGTFTIEGTSP